MLSQDERRRLAELERQTRQADPAFVARMSGAGEPAGPRGTLLICCLIWLVVPALAATGQWVSSLVVTAIAGTTTLVLLRLTRQRVVPLQSRRPG